MTQNSIKQNDAIVKSNKLQYLQLCIESRKDVENLKMDLAQQCKPQFSWEIQNSEISQKQDSKSSKKLKFDQANQRQEQPEQIYRHQTWQYDEDSHLQTQKQEVNIQKIDQKQSTQNKIKEEEIPKTEINGQQNKTNERQVQILYNKQTSNAIYLKTQLQQLIRLTAFSLLLEQEKQIKLRIYEINTQIRKQKIRSISNRRYQKQKKQQNHLKTAPRFQQLQRSIKDAKTKYNKLGTRLALIQNYLKVSQNPSKRQKSHKRTSTEYQPPKSPLPSLNFQKSTKMSTSRLKSPQKSIQSKHSSSYFSPNSPNSRDAYYSTKSIPISDEENKNDTNLLKQYVEILKLTIEEKRDYINKRVVTLGKEKNNLRRQIQMVKMDIIRVNNQNRRFRASSGSSLRRISRMKSSGRQFSPKLSKSPFRSKNLSSQKNWNIIGKNHQNTGSLDIRAYKSTEYDQLNEDNQQINQNTINSYLKYNISNETWTQSRKIDKEQDSMGEEIRNQYFNS